MNGALFLAIFLATAVEAVEAVTLVLASGHVNGFKSALLGAGAGVLVLGGAIAVLAPVLGFLPLTPLRLIMGAGMLYYGVKWLHKAILRASGVKALHDEAAIYSDTLKTAKKGKREGFLLSFNGVLMEGMEVVVIVIGLGAGRWTTGIAASVSAVVATVVVALIVRKPMSRVPENQMKLVVGAMLCAFGIFWFGEGVGIAWPGADLSLVGLLALVAAFAYLQVQRLRKRPALYRGYLPELARLYGRTEVGPESTERKSGDRITHVRHVTPNGCAYCATRRVVEPSTPSTTEAPSLR